IHGSPPATPASALAVTWRSATLIVENTPVTEKSPVTATAVGLGGPGASIDTGASISATGPSTRGGVFACSPPQAATRARVEAATNDRRDMETPGFNETSRGGDRRRGRATDSRRRRRWRAGWWRDRGAAADRAAPSRCGCRAG